MWPHDKGEDKSGKGNKCKTCLFFFLCDKVFVLISPSSLLQWASPPVHYLSPVNRPVLCGCDNKKHINHSFFFFCELLHRSNWNWFGVRDPPMKETTLRPILFSFKQLNSLSMDADFFSVGVSWMTLYLNINPCLPKKHLICQMRSLNDEWFTFFFHFLLPQAGGHYMMQCLHLCLFCFVMQLPVDEPPIMWILFCSKTDTFRVESTVYLPPWGTSDSV